jgi:phosphoenolpyruvate carboxykinase (ATP)
VPSELLRPRNTWQKPADYDAQARRLAGLFQTNFAKFAAQAPEAVRQAGPKV